MSEFLENNPESSDPMRYVLTSIMPEQKDSEFTWNDYRDRVNNELADVLGEFRESRSRPYQENIMKVRVPAIPEGQELTEVDTSLINELAVSV